MRSSAVLVLLAACATACAKETAKPAQPSPIQSVSVAPQSSGSPNEPALLLGAQDRRGPAPGDVERVKVRDETPDASFQPPKDRCPTGINEMMSVHLKLGESMETPAGASPVSALGGTPEAVEVIFDRTRRIVRVTAKRYGLVFVLTERDHQCTWYGVNSGY